MRRTRVAVVSRVHAGLHAGLRLPGTRDRGDRGPAPGDAAAARGCGVGGDRRPADRHLSARRPRRLGDRRTHQRGPVRPVSDAGRRWCSRAIACGSCRWSAWIRCRRVVPPPPATDRVPGVTVMRPGLLTTVQDAGRWGHQALGVPVGGALDARARRTANAAVGNAAGRRGSRSDAGGLRAAVRSRRARRPCRAPTSASSSTDAPLPLDTPVRCRAGASLCGSRSAARGARAYLALAGGVDVPPVLGSRSTDLGAGFGGFGGRALRAGDQAGGRSPGTHRRRCRARRRAVGHGGSRRSPRLRVLPGPHDDWFDGDALAGSRAHPVHRDAAVQPRRLPAGTRGAAVAAPRRAR